MSSVVFEPHVAGLPPLRAYVAEAWRRREFALELSRSTLRAQHLDTVFGQLWLLLNPLLLGGVYFVLVDIVRRGERPQGYFAHLLAGLFAYAFATTAIRGAVDSVTSGGQLVLNTAFPRVLLPAASVASALRRFVPMLAIYALVHVASGLPVTAATLWIVPLTALLTIMAAGFAMIVAALQVYFRDLSSFLPYLLRVWLYLSPVLYYADEVPERYEAALWLNPLGPLLIAWGAVLDDGSSPAADAVAVAAVWALATFAAGFVLFVSREREFAVRL